MSSILQTISRISIFIFLVQLSYGQNYPVQVSLSIQAPYPVKLSEYANSFNDKLQVQVLSKDLTIPEIPIKFSVRIENTHRRLQLETNNNFQVSPIHLLAGENTIYSSSEIGDYFQWNNLQVSKGNGTSIQNSGGTLPDGYYIFSIEVLEYYTGRRISNIAQFSCYIVQSDPPLLLLPIDESKVEALNPQFVNFSWNPRHLASPNKPINVTYRFQVVEILRVNQTAGDAFDSTLPIIDEEGLFSPSYQLGPIDTPLLPGQKYAWRVQAYDEDELGLIKNEGWSSPRLFQFGDACTICEQFSIANTTYNRVELTWIGELAHENYEVKYRRIASDEEDPLPWKTMDFLTEVGVVKFLNENTNYEFKIRGVCFGNRFSEWSPIISGTTETKPQTTYSCEAGVTEITFSNEEKYMFPLVPEEEFRAGDFDIIVVEDDLINDMHMGNGVIRIQAFNNVFFSVKWEDIDINTDFVLTNGEVQVEGADTDIVPEEIANLIAEGLELLIDGVKLIENVYAQLPEDLIQEYAESKENIIVNKEELGDVKEALNEAKRKLREAEDEGDEEVIERQKSIVNDLENQKSDKKKEIKEAKDRKKDAIKDILDYIKKELMLGVKYFVQFSNGVNRTIQAPESSKRKFADDTIIAGDSLLAFLEKLEGVSTIDPEVARLVTLASKDKRTRDVFLQDMENVINHIVGLINIDFNKNEIDPLGPAEDIKLIMNEMDAHLELLSEIYTVESIPEAIEATKISVWIFNSLFEEITEGVGEGVIQEGSDWAEQQRIFFQPNENTIYGFDGGGREADQNAYVLVEFDSAETYTIPWVAANGQEEVEVAFSGDSEDVFFQSSDGNMTSEPLENTIKLAINDLEKYTEWQAYKYINGIPQILGKINIQPYELKEYNITLVAINNQPLPDPTILENYLNTIYGKALIHWNVNQYRIDLKLPNSIWDISEADSLIEVSSSNVLSGYTKEQKKIIKYFNKNYEKPNDKEFVLFYGNASSLSNVKGFMPLSEHYGFIFNNGDLPTLRTAAHELGHGAFALQHPFERYPEAHELKEGQTKNLMDYASETKLWKWQWDLIQDPPPVMGMEYDDEEGMNEEENLIAYMERILSEHFANSSINLMVYAQKCSADSMTQNVIAQDIENNLIIPYISEGVKLLFVFTKSDLGISKENFITQSIHNYDQTNSVLETFEIEFDSAHNHGLFIYDTFTPLEIEVRNCTSFLNYYPIEFNYCIDSLNKEFVDILIASSKDCFDSSEIALISDQARIALEELLKQSLDSIVINSNENFAIRSNLTNNSYQDLDEKNTELHENIKTYALPIDVNILYEDVQSELIQKSNINYNFLIPENPFFAELSSKFESYFTSFQNESIESARFTMAKASQEEVLFHDLKRKIELNLTEDIVSLLENVEENQNKEKVLEYLIVELNLFYGNLKIECFGEHDELLIKMINNGFPMEDIRLLSSDLFTRTIKKNF